VKNLSGKISLAISRDEATRIIRRFEEKKADGEYERVLSGDASLLIWALRASGLTEAQIECASKEELNKLIIKRILSEIV